jgi:hypothetical protein
MLKIVILIPLSDFILKTLVFLGVLVLFNFWLKFFKLLLRIKLEGSSGSFDHTKGSSHCILVAVYVVFHVKHLEVGIDSKLSKAIEMEVKLIFIYRFEVLFNEVEVFESQPYVILTQVAQSAFTFIPHALHIVNIEGPITLFAEQSHCFLSFLNLIIAEPVSRSHGIEVSICQVKFSCLVIKSGSTTSVTHSFVDLSLQNVQLNHGWCMFYGLVQEKECLVEIS